MGFSVLIRRLATYFKRHGFRATTRRASLATRRVLFSNRQVVFYCDLANPPQEALPNFLTVERKKSYEELSAPDLHKMVSFWNPTVAQRNIEERLGKGASLWLIKSGEQLAGYGWTLQGRTIEPHYFPVGREDVHLFDFYVFPEHRGQGINPQLVREILRGSAIEGLCRAFIEAAEWNQAQLTSLTKTSFRRVGRARKMTMFGRTVVCWDKSESVSGVTENLRSMSAAVPRVARD